jgi:hypothetical protein
MNKVNRVSIASFFAPPDELEEFGLDILETGVYDVFGIERVVIKKAIYDFLNSEEQGLVSAFIEAHGIDNVAVGEVICKNSVSVLFAKHPKRMYALENLFVGSTGAKEIMILADRG